MDTIDEAVLIAVIDKMRLVDGYDEAFEDGYNAAIDDVLKILRH